MAFVNDGAGFRASFSRRWASAVAMGAFALLVIGAFIGLMVFDLVRMRSDALNASTRSTGAFAAMLAENVRQTAVAVDDVLKDFAPKLDGSADRSYETMSKIRKRLIDRLNGIVAVQSFVAFDADGIAFLNWRKWPSLTNGSDRDYYLAHRANPNLGLFVSSLFHNPGTDRDVIALTRRLNNPDGSFAGVFAISIDPNYFQHIYDQAAHSKKGSLALWRADSMLLVRHPFNPDSVGRTYPTAQLFTKYVKLGPSGTYFTRSPIDGVTRIVSYRAIDGAPLFVSVTDSYEEVLASWRELVGRYIGLAVLIALAVGGFAFTVHRQMAARASADGRFRAAVDSTSNAFFALCPSYGYDDDNPDFVVVDANAAATSLIGLDRVGLLGACLSAVAPGLRSNGVLALCAEARRNDEPQDGLMMFARPGTERWFRVRVTPFPDGVATVLKL